MCSSINKLSQKMLGRCDDCNDDILGVFLVLFFFGCKRVMLHNGDNDDRNCLSLSLSICYLYLFMGTVGMINKSDHSNI